MRNCKHYGVAKVLKFALPLVLTSLSGNLMFNVDRLMLAHYSVDAMNAAALAGNFTSTMSFAIVSIAQIAAVFVGQYNGLKEYKKAGWAPWQMIYLGLLSFLAFVPLGVFCHHFGIFPDYYRVDGEKYLRIILSFAGIQAIIGALTAFFVGLGRSSLVICAVLSVNVLNFLLNWGLIFGIDGIVSPLGIVGSATATIVSEITHSLLLLGFFLNNQNKTIYNTQDCKFRKNLFLACIKTGLPLSFGKTFSLVAWFIILSVFNYTSKDLATIEAFSINVWVIFIFFADGSGKAISSLSANLIGENDLLSIKKLYRMFFLFNLAACALFSIPLVWYQDMMFWFLDGISNEITHIYPEFRFVFVSMWLTILMDGIFYLTCGVLNSGGDTKFSTCLELVTLWIGVVLPTLAMYATNNLTTVRVTYTLLPITGVINCIVIYRRYCQQKWFTRLV
ncbi:MAG: hypothetical protein LBS14_03310 [Holosporaceae bacterium]|jgi:MATE family multidrug resistance protein|nr:hypothetical protein [Holosporaceae bacterium]